MKVDLVIEYVDTKDWYYIFIVHKDKKIKLGSFWLDKKKRKVEWPVSEELTNFLGLPEWSDFTKYEELILKLKKEK